MHSIGGADRRIETATISVDGDVVRAIVLQFVIHGDFKDNSVGSHRCWHVLELRDWSLAIDLIYVADEIHGWSGDVVSIGDAVGFQVEMKSALAAVSHRDRKTKAGDVGHRIKHASGGRAGEIKVGGFQAADVAGEIDVLNLGGSVVIGHAIDPQRSGVAGCGVCHRNGESPKDGNENSTNAQQLVPPADMFSVHEGSQLRCKEKRRSYAQGCFVHNFSPAGSVKSWPELCSAGLPLPWLQSA